MNKLVLPSLLNLSASIILVTGFTTSMVSSVSKAEGRGPAAVRKTLDPSDDISEKILRQFILVSPTIMPIQNRLMGGLRIRSGYTVAVESYFPENRTLMVRILKEVDNGPNHSTLRGFLKAIGSQMSEGMFEKNMGGHLDAIFVLKTNLWLLSSEEAARLPKIPVADR